MKILTDHIYPPIPTRRWDWSACIEGDEKEGPYGFGPTEQEAIDDLLEQLEE